jgi:hypothetical protein
LVFRLFAIMKRFDLLLLHNASGADIKGGRAGCIHSPNCRH